jgi:hypothetical protein
LVALRLDTLVNMVAAAGLHIDMHIMEERKLEAGRDFGVSLSTMISLAQVQTLG